MLRLIIHLISIIAITTSTHVSAEAKFGFSLGQSFSDEASRSDMVYSTIVQYSQPELDSINQDVNVNAFKIFASFNHKKIGALEIGYLDLGENTYEGNYAHNGDPNINLANAVARVDATARIDGFFLS